MITCKIRKLLQQRWSHLVEMAERYDPDLVGAFNMVEMVKMTFFETFFLPGYSLLCLAILILDSSIIVLKTNRSGILIYVLVVEWCEDKNVPPLPFLGCKLHVFPMGKNEKANAARPLDTGPIASMFIPEVFRRVQATRTIHYFVHAAARFRENTNINNKRQTPPDPFILVRLLHFFFLRA